MKINIKYIMALILFLSCIIGQAQEPMTLDKVISQIKENSFAAKTAQFQIDIAKENNKFYKSLLKPTLGLSANLPNYRKTSSPIIQPDGIVAFQPIRQGNSSLSIYASQVISKTGGTLFLISDLQRFDDFTSQYKQYNGIPIRLGISQPILGYNPWKYDQQIQPLLLKEAEKEFSVSVEAMNVEATRLYFDILVAAQNLEIAKTNEKVNSDLLIITEERLELGKVSRDEKLQLEIELNNARLAVSNASNQLDQAKSQLSVYIGLSDGEGLNYIEPTLLETVVINFDALQTHYQTNRPEFIAFQRALLESDQAIAQAKAEFGFQASINASIGLARGAATPNEIYSDPFDEQQFNISVLVPILDWGKKNAAVGSAELRKKNIKVNLEQQLKELDNDVKQLAVAFSRLQRDLSLIKENMEKADERFQISNERYVLGNIDITNLTLAQREKDNTKRTYISALQQYWTLYYQLRMMTGYDINKNAQITY